MYDCPSDHCQDSSAHAGHTQQAARPLRGILSASPVSADDAAQLDELNAYAARHGYQAELNEQTLVLQGVSLADALAINDRFAKRLIISCDLRCNPPVLFG